MNSQDSLHGLLLVDKPKTLTSHDVVNRVRRAIGQKTVGHAGTLDPEATGLLVLLLGEATKLSEHILMGQKSYDLKVLLGVETDSHDLSGVVVKEQVVNIPEEKIVAAIQSLTGDLMLPPPIFSAIKVDGQKLYKVARKQRSQGQVDESKLKPRPMSFFDVIIHEIRQAEISLSLKCSKGSYIRSWTKKLGEVLGCGATLAELRRTWSNPYSVDSAVDIERLGQIDRQELTNGSSFIPVSRCLIEWESIVASPSEEMSLKNGQVTQSLKSLVISRAAFGKPSDYYKVVSQDTGKLVAILSRNAINQIYIKRVFNY